MRRLTVSIALAAAVACGPELPEPESAGGRIMLTKCGGCHRVYVPQLMTFEMWKVQLDRKERLHAKERRPWLSEEEERILLAYIERHAGTR